MKNKYYILYHDYDLRDDITYPQINFFVEKENEVSKANYDDKYFYSFNSIEDERMKVIKLHTGKKLTEVLSFPLINQYGWLVVSDNLKKIFQEYNILEQKYYKIKISQAKQINENYNYFISKSDLYFFVDRLRTIKESNLYIIPELLKNEERSKETDRGDSLYQYIYHKFAGSNKSLKIKRLLKETNILDTNSFIFESIVTKDFYLGRKKLDIMSGIETIEIYLKSNFPLDLDLFFIPQLDKRILVSESLKIRLEFEKISGIKFKEIKYEVLK